MCILVTSRLGVGTSRLSESRPEKDPLPLTAPPRPDAPRLGAASPGARLPRASSLAAALCAAGWVLVAVAAARVEAAPDTTGVRFEAGASSDVTNELFYEDAFIDTTFIGRRTLSSPETRYAAAVLGVLAGTRAQGTTSYRLQNELSVGDKLTRNALALDYRSELSPDWRMSLTPTVEYRHDRSFDRDLEQWRANAGLRFRRAFHDAATFAEFGGGAELLRSRGVGADFIPDRQSARVAAALDHFALLGHEWRAGYSLAARAFPDSTVRDHFEHGWQGQYRQEFGGGHSVSLDVDGIRRVTRRPAPTSRDQFWNERIGLEGRVRAGNLLTWIASAEGEALQYDVEDSTLYFDYQVLRGRLGPRLAGSGGWSVAAGPRGELLFSRLSPEETYHEIGGFVELELIGAGAWWNVVPAAGWRAYGQGVGDTVLHSSYAFYELSVFGEQLLPGGLRLRALGTGRLESHIDSAQDSRSLYFSLDLRYLF